MDSNFSSSTNETNNIKETLIGYTKHWKWFVITVVIAICLGHLKIRYTTPLYAAGAKLQILDEESGSSGLALFQDIGVLKGKNSKVADEVEILNSVSNFAQVVEKLKLNVFVVELGSLRNSERYENKPFNINFIAPDSVINNSSFTFFVEIYSKENFGYAILETAPSKAFAYGKNISSPIGDIVLTPPSNFIKSDIGKKFQVVINPVLATAAYYREMTSINMVSEESNIVDISILDNNINKAVTFLDKLMLNYNQNAVEDKKNIADRTSDFIDARISEISSNLTSVDQSAEDFKSGRGLSDIASETNLNLSVGAENQQQLQDFNTQLSIASSMRDYVDDEDDYESLPSNVGLSDASIASTTAKYNQLVAERKRLLKSSNEKNPVIVNLNQQLDGLKNEVQSSLSSMTTNLSAQVNSLAKQQSRINSRIYSAPKNERALRDITRKQQTTESLYLYLLQKREEAQIAYASASPKSKIIDASSSYGEEPVEPKKTIIYLASFIFGLLIPFSIIYIKDLLDNKIHGKINLEKSVKNIPVLAELPRLKKKDEKVIEKEDRSVLAESLRILRTNLSYVLQSKNNAEKQKIIFVTSSVSGEGKTFISTNLALIFAQTGKKVLLIGADIRNPKLGVSFVNAGKSKDVKKPDFGLTEFLYKDVFKLKDVTVPKEIKGTKIDVVYSGKIPPNPAELLMSDRMEVLFKEAKELYDYVVVDTAPMMLVTDTLLISKFSNLIIYVTRAGVTETKAVDFPLNLVKEGKIKNLAFVVNDVSDSNLGYGGKYGYGYGQTTKKWWKF